jgi:TolB-like protein
VSIGSKKARGVLAWLALAPKHSATREQLASTFWSLSGEEQARQSLRQCLSALRKALGDRSLIRSDGEFVALDGERIAVDVAEVQHAMSSTPLQTEAAECARGRLLQDHIYGEQPLDDWIRDSRTRVHGSCQRYLFRCAAAHEKDGDDDSAIELYERILRLNPPCEEAHRGLMGAYLRQGRRSDALGQYEQCRDALARHLDATPSTETTTLFESLRGNGAPAAQAEPAPSLPTLPLPDEPAIVVLPFRDLSGDDSQGWLCHGISDDITTSLSQFSSLMVISRSAASRLSAESAIPAIGRQLGVHYVLQGSLQLQGEQLRVAAQLVDAERGRHIWSERYQGSRDDMFSFQDDLVQRVVATTVGRIEADALARARRKSPDQLDAWECVLRGRYHHHRRTREDSQQALVLFEQALKLQPEYPLAAGWHACATARLRSFDLDKATRASSQKYLDWLLERVKVLEGMVALDPEESECLRLIGEIYLFHQRFDDAERYLQQAYRFNPSDDKILMQMAAFLAFTDRFDEAVSFARRAIRANPYHPGFFQFNLGRALMLTRQFEQALGPLRAASPSENRYRAHIAGCLAALGRDQEAAEITSEILRAQPDFRLSSFKAALMYRNPDTTDWLLGLMRKAGLPD